LSQRRHREGVKRTTQTHNQIKTFPETQVVMGKRVLLVSSVLFALVIATAGSKTDNIIGIVVPTNAPAAPAVTPTAVSQVPPTSSAKAAVPPVPAAVPPISPKKQKNQTKLKPNLINRKVKLIKLHNLMKISRTKKSV